MTNVYDREAIARATKLARGLESLESQLRVTLHAVDNELRFTDLMTGQDFALGDQPDSLLEFERGLGIAED